MQGIGSVLTSFSSNIACRGPSVVSLIKTVALTILLALPLTGSARITCSCENLNPTLDENQNTDCDAFCKSDFNALTLESSMNICEDYLLDLLDYTSPFFDPNEDNYKPKEAPSERLVCHKSNAAQLYFKSLEQDLSYTIEVLPNPDTFTGFKDFRQPNEAHPEQIYPILDTISPGGVLVSAGSERGFFTLALAEEGLFSGLVIRDIHPKIKAYVDFNILLFRLASSREEYNRLSEMKTTDGFREKIEDSNIPHAMKIYYLNNLDTLALAYQEVDQDWRACTAFHRVDYSKNDVFFQRIKKLADSGNIVSAIGDITDVDFLHDREISMIDISNIYDYSPNMTFKKEPGFHPVIVYTNLLRSGIYADRYIYQTLFYKHVLNKSKEEESLSIWDFFKCKMIFG